ncbi:signal peptide protein [Cryptosporidium sp. chipmunk genotype I]|uniref:signal peptide protein n=1 Tax=Cryptosporidium sp. chipmunk genotype I TaxID=1280935 RepID=UPI003519E035|nr:signal peptide protein [Cryptosporidium sp. chipmunk genotype I]
MNTIKLTFASLVLCFALFSNFLGIHYQLISSKVSYHSLIKLRSPGKFFRKCLCCCKSSGCESSSSSCISGSGLNISGPEEPRHVWSATSDFGGFRQQMEVLPPRDQSNEQDLQTTGQGANSDQSSNQNNEDCQTPEDREENSGCKGSCSSCNRRKSSSSKKTEGFSLNPYDGYNGNKNPAFSTE